MSVIGLKVLVVEDSKLYRSCALNALKGHNKFVAETVADGYQIFVKEKPDVTFLDINLKDGSGLDLLCDIKKIDRFAFVVMMSSQINMSLIQESQANGAAGYIAKPFNMERIQKCIVQYIDFSHKLTKMKSEEDIELSKAKEFAELRKKSAEEEANSDSKKNQDEKSG
ncbi:MAG: response regulator [Pseudomonadota bacterium]